MISNVFLVTGIISVTVFFSTFGYDYYVSVTEAKQMQQTYDDIAQIKKLIAKQYNKNPDEITRDELIAILPKGKNWEKLFLSNRNDSLNFDANSIINENTDFVLSSDDKLKLLALKSKLNSMQTLQSNQTTFSVSSEEFSRLDSENIIKKESLKVKDILSYSSLSLDEILANENYDDTQIVEIKEYLKNDLENSSNSFDLQIYQDVKDSL